MKFLNLAKKVLTNKYLALAFRLYLGGLFVYASIYKINYTGEFAESIAAYQIVPYWAVNVMAIVMSWTELLCGALLIVGIRSKSAVCMIGGLLALFAAAVVLTLVRNIPIGCGCFSSTEPPMSWLTVLRDLAWLALAVHVYYFDSALQLERKFLIRISEI